MNITIGIPTYNGALRLDQLLKSITLRYPSGAGYPLFLNSLKIVVVDDGSPRVAETRDVVNFWRKQLPLSFVEHGENRGIAPAWNTATRLLPSDYIVLINDDVVVPSGPWLEALLLPLSTGSQVGAVGANWHAFTDDDVPGLLENHDSDRNVTPRDPNSKQPAPERRAYELNPPGRVMCPTGQLFAFRRSDFDEIGGFDEEYKSFFEESCFGTSMAAMGKIGVQLNWPMCWHRWSATFGSNPELQAGARMAASRRRYIEKWKIPSEFHGDSPGPFDYTNPKFMKLIGPVEFKYIAKEEEKRRALLRSDGSIMDVVER